MALLIASLTTLHAPFCALSSCSEARHRGLKGLRSLKTPPERVPLPHQDDRSVKIDQLVDERR